MEHFGVVCLFVILFGVSRDSYTYVSASTICGGNFNSTAGIVTSLNYPGSYPHDTVCEWFIEDPNKHRLVLDVVRFEIEKQKTCDDSYDYLEIRDGAFSNSTLLGRYCGTTIPARMTSQGYRMYLKFKSDDGISFPGFSIAWGSVMAGAYSSDGHYKIHGEHFYSLSGVITSPNYPGDYPHNLIAEWIIEAPRDHLVVLSVKNFHTESGPDYLEIRNGVSAAKSTLIGRYYGSSIPKNITSTGNRIFLQFRTDGSVTYRGFMLEWDSTKLDCGGRLNSSHGSISSPYYPEPYSPPLECNWDIRVAAGSIIQVILVDLEFETAGQCQSDFLDIYEGLSDKRDKKLGNYCQTINHPLFVETSSNVASVHLRSNHTISSRRFRLIYHTICRNKLYGSEGEIESPNFPDKYLHRENCSWIIEAPVGKTLELTFPQFNLEGGPGNDCKNDYLTITEGKNDEPNRVIGKFCNSNRPPSTIHTTQRQVFLEFHSDNSAAQDGFRIRWVTAVPRTVPPSPRSCLLWSGPVSQRNDYTYMMGNGGHKLHTNAATWNEARITCEQENGYLAIVNSVAELNAITKLFGNSTTLASIGVHAPYGDGRFLTIHGQSLNVTGITQWGDGQPDNSTGSENCGALSFSGELHDVSCENKYGFVCEVPPY